MTEADSSPTRLIEASFGAACVGASVDFCALLPADFLDGEPLPLITHLHDAFSTASDSLVRARPLYDELWLAGGLPRSMIACANTPTRGGFYIDQPGANWETLVAVELPAYLRTHYAPGIAEALIGPSVGGYAALKLICTAPWRYVAAAAISPAIFPSGDPGDVKEPNMPAALAELHAAMVGTGADPAVYLENSVQGRARRHATELREAAPRILIDRSADDEPLVQNGAEDLHAVLADLGIDHRYRTVSRGSADSVMATRTREAIRFLGQALSAASRPGLQ